MRILLADDHDMVRDGIKAYLEATEAGVIVTTAADLDGALALAMGDGAFDVALLDLFMPGMNGLAGLDRFRAALPQLPLAVLSGTPCTPELVSALARVRASFIPKTLSGARLLSVLRMVTSGKTYAPNDGGTSAASPPDGEPAGPHRPLTQRERDVLGHLVLGLSNKEIARQLSIEEVTVRLHLRGLYRKLDARNRTQAVRRAIDRGLAS